MNSRCETCKLYKQCKTHFVKPRGNLENPNIIIIGESPGRTEDFEGKPFVGKSGKLLEEVFRLFNKKFEEVCYITNVVKCCPYADPFNPNKGVRPPTDKEIECCLPYLLEELEKFKGKDVVIMPLGNTALKGLGIRGKITELVGKELEWNGFKVIPNFHPAAVLRNPKWKQKFISVFGKVIDNRQMEWENLIKPLQPKKAINFLQKKLEEKPEWFCFDIETNGLDPFKDEIIMLTFSFPDDPYGYVVPLYQKDPLPGDNYDIFNVVVDNISKQKVLQLTKQLLETIPVIGHNIKFDLKFMVTKTGLDLSKVKVKDDTLFLAHFVFNKVQLGETLQLKDIAVKVLGLDGRWDEEVKEYLKSRYRLKKDRHYGNIPTSLLIKYAGFDVLFTKEIYLVLSERVKVFNCDEIREALNKATIMIAESEIKGVKVDKQVRDFLDYKYQSEIEKAERELQELPKIKEWKELRRVSWFNPSSQKHQKEVAFKVYQLPVVETTQKGQPSLGKNAINTYLSSLPEDSEEKRFIELFYRIKLFKKLKSTYINGFISSIDELGMYHPEFNIAGTITGRWSSGFHTVASKSDIKRMFVSRWKDKGGLIVSFDYSQLEVRVAASLANETKLIDAYKQGIDVHKRTASMIFNKPMEEITKQERKIAKTVVFGILYGKTAKSLAEDFNISLEEAEKWVENLYGGYTNLRKWIENQHRFVLANGFVVTAFNRVIPVPMAFESDKWKKEEAKRKAVNYPVQSSASDLTTTSAVRLWENMKKLNLKSVLIGTVHDAIVIDVYPGELITVFNLVIKNAEIIPIRIYDWLTCPIRIDATMGDGSWFGGIEWERKVITPDCLELEGTGFVRDLLMFKQLIEMSHNVEVEKINEEDFDEPAIDQFIYSPKKETWRVKIWK